LAEVSRNQGSLFRFGATARFFAGAAEFGHELHKRCKFSEPLFCRQLEVLAQQRAINITHVIAHGVFARSTCVHQSEHNTTARL
jgi:hypothetical protein